LARRFGSVVSIGSFQKNHILRAASGWQVDGYDMDFEAGSFIHIDVIAGREEGDYKLLFGERGESIGLNEGVDIDIRVNKSENV
jgi:hypothetical protein